MARAVVLALAWAALAAGARYVDYSVEKVPEYGVAADYDGPRDLPASDEYRDPVTDSSASLDYKYEETPRRSEKSVSKEISQSNSEDPDNWQKRERKARRKSSNDDGNLETLDKYSPLEMIPKFHPSDRLSVRPNNVKLRKSDRESKVPTRVSKFKVRKDEFQDDFESEGNMDLHDDYSYDKKSNFGNRVTTTRGKKARRKPRDRYVKSREVDDLAEGDQDLVENPDNSNKKYQDYFEDRKDIDPQKRRRLESSNEDDKLLKSYPDITEKKQFYPVQMEKKNPSDFLLDTDSEFERMRPEPFDFSGKLLETVDPEARRKFSGGRRFGGMSNEGKRKEHAHPNLRVSDEQDSDKREKSKPKSFISQQYDSDEDYYDMKRAQNIKNKLPSLARRTTKATTRATQRWGPSTRDLELDWKNRRVFVPEPEKRETTITTTSSTTTTSTTTTKTPDITTTPSTTTLSKEELSFAEKSRLSILKKALRKDVSANMTSTSKPPVLMQIAANMQTLAIVEPASSHDPIFRAKEVFDDNPNQLDRVKRLMRHKLVANAKDIRDLTENWDDMVCDYIDTSLLDSASSKRISFLVVLPFLLIL